MYEAAYFRTCLGDLFARPIVVANLFTILDCYKMYSACWDELEAALLIALEKREYIKNTVRGDCIYVTTYFGNIAFDEQSAKKLYKAMRFSNTKVIKEFCNDILTGLSDFYREGSNK